MFLTAIGLVAGTIAAVPLSAKLLAAIWMEPSGWLAAAWWVARAAVFVVLVYVVAVALPIVVAAPLMERLSIRVEELELGAATRAGGIGRAAAEAVTGVGNTLARTGLLLLGHVILLPTLLVPFAWPVLAFLWTAWWSSVEWLDLPMARHLHRFRAVRAALVAVRPFGFGMGCTLAALFLLPLANLLVVPVGTIAGTLLYCELVRAGIVAPDPVAPVAPERMR
jgi:CysZ protein